MYTPEQLAKSIAAIRARGEEQGRDMTNFSFGLYIFSTVHEDNDRAVSFAVDRLSKQYSRDFSKLVPKYALAGDPISCQARLSEYVEAGANTILMSSACRDDYVDTNLELMAAEVIPAFRT